ncbi:MAG: extracellular solute-binding protein [Chloroflexota bacterium]|nr:extracellular solute-binding protein [Chloroflexota bacterium]
MAMVACGSAPAAVSSPASAAAAGTAKASATAAPSGLAALYAAAKQEGSIVWYESSPPAQADQVIRAFNATYPDISIKHVVLTGSQPATRIITESAGGGKTGDVATAGIDAVAELEQRHLIQDVDWTSLGVAKDAAIENLAVQTADTPFVLLYNTKLVKESDVPTSWQALTDPKWKGKIAAWVQPYLPAELTFAWGMQKTDAWVKAFMANKPALLQSTFPVSSDVAAGEYPLGLPVLHTTFPPADAGAPIKYTFLDPTPNEILASWVPTNAAHPNAGKLFAAWLASPVGNVAYENATGRGSRSVAGTRYHKLLAGLKLSEPQWKDAPTLLTDLKKLSQDWK